jgi:copper chaperone CopZ
MKKSIRNSESHSPIQASQSRSTDVRSYVFQHLALLFLLPSFLLITPSCATLKNSTSKETTTIQTNAECGQCKEKIEGKLNYTKGIIFAELDVPSKELTVKYKTNKITLEEIRVLVSEIGYDADEVKANPESQENLPKCCQPGGMSR